MYWNRLMDLVEEYFQLDKVKVLYVLCPFINTELIEKLLLEQEEVVIVTSWRKDHLLTGVSSLSLFELVSKHPKWTLRINDRLHAKVFTRSFEDMLFGSANLTYKALEDKSSSNFEVMNYAKCTQKDELEILEIINQSLQITESEYQQYLSWYEENKDKNEPLPDDSLLEPLSMEKEFLISSLPGSTSPRRIWDIISEQEQWDHSWNEQSAAIHDLKLFGLSCDDYSNYDEFLGELKTRIPRHPFVEAFCEQITTDGLYFGRAKQWIQETCIDDPVPFRKEITGYVISLFAWLVEIYPERYIIEQPNYSQLIRRIDLCRYTNLPLKESIYISNETFYSGNGIQYKSCPRCSFLSGNQQLIFRIARTNPNPQNIEINQSSSEFGFSNSIKGRITKRNPDGIQSLCKSCRVVPPPMIKPGGGISAMDLDNMLGHFSQESWDSLSKQWSVISND